MYLYALTKHGEEARPLSDLLFLVPRLHLAAEKQARRHDAEESAEDVDEHHAVQPMCPCPSLIKKSRTVHLLEMNESNIQILILGKIFFFFKMKFNAFV